MQNQVVGRRFFITLIASSLLSLIAVPGMAGARDECVNKPAVFDGIQPLTYQQVKASLGEKIYIFKHFSDTCSPSKSETCHAPYIVQGDTVALAKICGSRAFVQYLGLRSLTTGWVDTGSLKAWIPPHEDETAVFGPTATIWREQFRLIRGKGVPVCEAYLQRLNKTFFHRASYCGRPENSAVPGFERLHRQYLSTKEVNEIADTGIADRFILSTWRYDPPIDADNDGRPDNLLLWNLDDAQEPHCSLDTGGPGGEDTGFQIALIMSSDNKSVDITRTVEIFGDADPRTAEPLTILNSDSKKPLIYNFPALGTSYSLFRYRATTYFDTYVGRERDHVTGSMEPRQLWVFLRRNNSTHAVCVLR